MFASCVCRVVALFVYALQSQFNDSLYQALRTQATPAPRRTDYCGNHLFPDPDPGLFDIIIL